MYDSKAKRNNERHTQYEFGDSFVEINAHFNSDRNVQLFEMCAFSHGSTNRFFFLLSFHTKARSLLNFVLSMSKKGMTIVKAHRLTSAFVVFRAL